jgi:hypothetical protein
MSQLLSQFCLDSGCPGPALVAAAVKQIVEVKRVEAYVHHMFAYLPHWLQKPNPPIIIPAFGDEHNDHPQELGGDLSVIPYSSHK